LGSDSSATATSSACDSVRWAPDRWSELVGRPLKEQGRSIPTKRIVWCCVPLARAVVHGEWAGMVGVGDGGGNGG
jgi:hypothetical protein